MVKFNRREFKGSRSYTYLMWEYFELTGWSRNFHKCWVSLFFPSPDTEQSSLWSCRIPDFRSPNTGLYANLAHLGLPSPVSYNQVRFTVYVLLLILCAGGSIRYWLLSEESPPILYASERFVSWRVQTNNSTFIHETIM